MRAVGFGVDVERQVEILEALVAVTSMPHAYADAVEIVLDTLVGAVAAPLIGLGMREPGAFTLHIRTRGDVDPEWVEETRQQIQRRHDPDHGEWIDPTRNAVFPAAGRGLSGTLIVAAPEPIDLTEVEEQALDRIARQAILVLGHLRLLEQLEGWEALDSLTGVASERRLHETLEYEIARHQHAGRPLALLFLDIEGLAALNRTYGRSYGNHVLRRIAETVREAVRPIDIVARSGLDEFAVILPESDEETAEEMAEQLQARLAGVQFAGGTVAVTVASLCRRPGESLTVEAMLRRGEQLLYETKAHQRSWRTLAARQPAW
ncbi:MAG TPA: GGDEF domain-containing protein [Chloroflexota bacterium]|nr:GGDEF domain-containing protein [Chloroflexota bacterium]